MKKCHQCDQQYLPEPELALCPYCGFAEGIAGMELLTDSETDREEATTPHSKIRQYSLWALSVLLIWSVVMLFYLAGSFESFWRMLSAGLSKS